MEKQELTKLVRRELGRVGVGLGDVLVVAVSGGPDSMVLLELLRKEKDQRIVVVHVNHGLRKEADKEEKIVAGYAKKYKLEFVSRKVSLGSRKTGIEERARDLRYAALQDVAREYGARWIVTAHTADDQVETVIANWLRGSAVRGLGGIRMVSGNIVRPLLNVWKKELLEYAKKHKLRYAIDSSNTNLQFTRNRIRRQLLPQLRKFNSHLDMQILHNSRIWQQADNALGQLAEEFLQKVGERTRAGVVLSISKLKELSPLMQVEVIKAAIRMAGGGLVDLEKTHFVEVMKLIASPKEQVAKRRLGGELFASKAYDKITVSQN